MPEPLTQYNLDVWIAYNQLSSSMNNWRNHFYALGDAIAGQFWATASAKCYDLGNDFSTYVRADLCDSGGIKGKTYQSLDWIDDNWPADGDEYELTAIKICEAWAKNSFEERALTIAFIDRMRTLIWDEPFYVVWAARPESESK